MTIVDGPIVPFDSNTTFDEQRTSFDINQGKYVDPVYSSQVSSVFAGYDSRPKQSLPGMGSDTPPSYVPFAERVDSQVPYHPTSLENAVYQSSSVDINPLDANPSYSRDAFDSSSRASIVSEGPSAAATSSDFIKPVYHQIEDVQASSYRDMNPYSTQGNHVEKSSVYPASGEPVMTIVDGPTVPFDSNSTFDAQRTPLDINQGRYIDPVYSEHSQANAVSSGYDSTIPVASNFDGRSHSFYPTPPNSADYQSPSVDFDPMNTNSIQSGDAFDSSSRASIVSEGPSAAATSLDYIKPVYHQIEDVQTSSYRDMNPYSTQGNHVEKSSVYPASGEPVMTIVDGPTVPFDSNSTFDAQRTPLDINQGRYIDPVYSEHSQANAVSSGYDSFYPRELSGQSCEESVGLLSFWGNSDGRTYFAL
eukprot:TRINITY_DN1168_c1_g1_i8.p1 TRINITY_DN1168_c1_g1~~TRINITY_DN1168_c1_g1_i8.p1  ORF type:complete len:419 (+),score=37.91 TRINITY_DN1168_c1_g1_i8:3-1259(+)